MGNIVYQSPVSACIRRRNSLRSIYFAAPLSTSASRRKISLSHSSAAFASTGAFKLSTKACACSVRSGPGAINAMEQSWNYWVTPGVSMI